MKRIIIPIMIIMLSACGKPESLEDAGYGIIKINDPDFFPNKNTLVIDVKTNTSFFGLASNSEEILSDISSYFPNELDKYNEIWIFANTDLVDTYGNSSTDRTIGLMWKTSDIKKIDFGNSNFTTFGMINLSQDVRALNRVGYSFADDWCNDEDNLKYTLHFCAMYLGKYN